MTNMQKVPCLPAAAGHTTCVKSFSVSVGAGPQECQQNCPCFYLQGKGSHPELGGQEPGQRCK